MRVRVLCNLGHKDYGDDAVSEGEHDLPQKMAERLIARGLAEPIASAPIETKAEPIASAPIETPPQKPSRKEK